MLLLEEISALFALKGLRAPEVAHKLRKQGLNVRGHSFS